MANAASVGKLCKWMDQWYPPSRSEQWDRVGLIVGDPQAPVRRVMLAVDPVETTVSEALWWNADLLITHHPLYLRGTSFLPVTDPKGLSVTRLIRGGCALFNAHTNADKATGGVAQALAEAVGLRDIEPLMPEADDPTQGELRIGYIDPTPLADFAEHVAGQLPAGPTGLFVGGDPQMRIHKIAVCGGAGDSYLDACRNAGVDAYITADLRHHPASECLEHGQMALLCGSHWATEWLWLPHLARQLQQKASDEGIELEVKVSQIVTEPWTMRFETGGGNR